MGKENGGIKRKQETWENVSFVLYLLLGQWILCEQILKSEFTIHFAKENIL